MTVGTVDVKNQKRKKPTFSFFVYSPSARAHASRYQRIRMVVAVGTADVKKKERKKKPQPFAYADGRMVVVVAIHASRHQRIRVVVVAAIGTADVKKERKKNQPFAYADGWSSTRMDNGGGGDHLRAWWCGDGCRRCGCKEKKKKRRKKLTKRC